METLIMFFIAVLIFGTVGGVLGGTVNKSGAGLFLGLLLGPIGWIIVFLLPRDSEESQVPMYSSSPTPPNLNRPERDLESDAYKIWLGKQHNITRNDLFEKFECDEKLFDSLLDALTYADDLEKQQEEKQESDRRERSAQLEQQTVGEKEHEESQDDTSTDTVNEKKHENSQDNASEDPVLVMLIMFILAGVGAIAWLIAVIKF